jgi:UDP-2,3-diacylglucosamine pyrophosphatase LpxH
LTFNCECDKAEAAAGEPNAPEPNTAPVPGGSTPTGDVLGVTPDSTGTTPIGPKAAGGGQSRPSGWWCAPQSSPDPTPTPRGDGKTRTVIISDVHIGTNAKTCWYQRAVHEPYLSAVLDYVVAHADAADEPVKKLVLLGDLFDFWTYPPDQRPPAIDDIIAANERILGSEGKLSQAVHALRGNVIYLRGNHDIGMTQADLDRLPLGDYKIPLVDDVVVDESGIVLTHGHLFTMFNAPDARYPDEVPVGHFVTRAIAHLLENTLSPGQTAADLANQGSPYGFSLDSFVPALLAEVAGPSITNLMLDYFAARCGLSEGAPIVMADGSTTTINQVKKKYDGLWDDWVGRHGGGDIGETVATKAVKADYNGDYMAWFAQKTAWDHAGRGAVTGHTHVPKQGIENSTCLYVNCGFECPSVPDIAGGSGVFNFGVIDAAGTPALWCVVKDQDMYCVGPCDHVDADQVVYAPFSDFSCYVTIENSSTGDLARVTEQADNGYYVTRPPETIAAGATARFWLQDLPGIHGAEGSTAYAPAGDKNRLNFVYGCPTGIFQNYASGGSSFVANSGSPPGAAQPPNVVPGWGHPLYVDFRVDDSGSSGAQPWTPRSLLAYAVVAAGFWYDPGQDIIYSTMNPLQRLFGYAYGYDAAALGMSAIIDCEPIFFDYAGKTWMIELWKGQYGLETGCEIGVYNRVIGSSGVVYSILDATVGKRPGDTNASHNLFFDCVGDSELLLMSSTLYRNGQKVFSRGPEKHWWLTGFKWGLYSEPQDLTMDVSITCLDNVMTTALVNALTGMGYPNVQTNGDTVTFTFDTPKTRQPRDDYPQIVTAVRSDNQAIVSAYDSLGLTSNDPNTVGDQAAATIARSFAIYSAEFFKSVIANLANLIGIALADALRALAQGFQMALDEASQLLTNAGYTFASWINGVGDFITEALDFSCVIEVSNRGGPYELVRDSYGVGHGNWAVEPPQRIAAGGVGRFWLKDPKPSADGSDGWVRYAYVDSSGTQQSVRFDFSDPTAPWSPNQAKSSSGAFNFYTKSGSVNAAWNGMNQVTTGGHPFYVAFVWGNAPLPSDA